MPKQVHNHTDKRTASEHPTATGQSAVWYGKGELTDFDVHLFREGSFYRIYEKLGAHLAAVDGVAGVHFAVWAPNAERVSVVGDFNGWDPRLHTLGVRWDGSGIWEGFIPEIRKGEIYKYHIVSRHDGYRADKGDPFAYYWETSPRTASRVWDLEYAWNDHDWMARRHQHNNLRAPMSIYEVHLGSWRRRPEDGNRFLTYRELAPQLADYVKEMGFTHVEFLPVMEHPFYGSWGYQTGGYFAPTSRFGTPQDFMSLVDVLHQHGIGVILDWVPSHFPSDLHGLSYFDGTHLFEHADPRQGFHPDWKSYIFNFGRNEIRNFLIGNALFWLEKYHVDGLRVDAVASMLYLDYSRNEGEWIPNEYGGRENTAAIDFLKRFNEMVYKEYPDVQTVAEESTAWPMVSRPIYLGGLGFGQKWNMGWMHDTLKYFSHDSIHRSYHHNELTFSIWYAFYENFVLPLSHDEVVHGKGSLMNKMPGDEWQQAANLRLLYGYMFTHPGKKLLFMGAEFGQRSEWSHDHSLDWHVLQYPVHQGVQSFVRDLNRLYRSEPALHRRDYEMEGFRWIDCNDWQQSIISYLRFGDSEHDMILVVCNMTPVPRHGYQVGVPKRGYWNELLNSDSHDYGGSGQGNLGGVNASDMPLHGHAHSLTLTLPPLGIVVLKPKQD